MTYMEKLTSLYHRIHSKRQKCYQMDRNVDWPRQTTTGRYYQELLDFPCVLFLVTFSEQEILKILWLQPENMVTISISGNVIFNSVPGNSSSKIINKIN